MTLRFTSSALDLSTVASSQLFDAISFESIRLARITDLKARLIAAGWEYDVEALETDPGIYLSEAGAFRETLNQQAVNDAVCSVLLAFAKGPYLDRLGDNQGTARMAGEGDDRYRARIQLAPEAYSATGTPGGYIYYAMGSEVTIFDVGCAVLNRGTPNVMVELTIMSDGADGNFGAPTRALVDGAYEAVNAADVKLLTDTVSVRAAVGIPYQVSAVLNLLPGPDPKTVIATAQASLTAMVTAYKRLVLGVPLNSIIAALSVPGVDSVTLLQPTASIATQRFQFGYMTSSSITAKIIGQPFPITEVGSYSL